jgi:Ca2+-binding EF-hand superfamily protein
MKFPIKTGLVVVVIGAAAASHAQAPTRFDGMDRNRDGVITRDEWRGNDQSFSNEDWNGDGVLSGDEVRPGARKPSRARNTGHGRNHDGTVNQQDVLIKQRFNGYDRDGDGRISQTEWRTGSGDSALFQRLDANRDRNLTLAEYTSGVGAQGGPSARFSDVDRNHDNWITRNEWNMNEADFNGLDANRDNRISQTEFQAYSNSENPYQTNSRFTGLDANHDGLITWNEWRGTEGDYVRLDTNGDARINPSEFDANPTAAIRFATLDANRDGWVTRTEWRWSEGSFYRMDTNSDNRLNRNEFQSGLANAANRVQGDEQNVVRRNGVTQAGYDRGTTDGRQAGREDQTNGHGWDLEGQTELEGADAGYDARLGTRGDYQTGYREGFRLAYHEGFGGR